MDDKLNQLPPDSISTPASGTGTETLNAPMEWMGPAGKYVELHVMSLFENPPGTNDERREDRSLRTFKVSCTLGKFWRFYGSKLAEVTPAEGSSFLVGPPDFSNLEVNLEGGRFIFSKNEQGEYSYVDFECDATSHKQAQHIFQRGLGRFLDILVYRGETPIFIQSVRIEDTKNKIIVLPQFSPFRHQSVMLGDIKVHAELVNVYSMYREGKNSSSNFYRFLCFYKALEGLVKSVRPLVRKNANAAGIELAKEYPKVPNDPHLIIEHRHYIGMSIGKFIDSVLTKTYRDAVAHFTLRDGTVLNMSAPEHIERYTFIVYITEICMRVLIDECEALLLQLELKHC
jgi:hypothetical protein